MSAHCAHSSLSTDPCNPTYRRVLWIALTLNFGMFALELLGGIEARSVSLWGDAIDFLGDGLNYAVSLAVLGAVPATRAKTALFKAACMLAFGAGILGYTAWQAVLHWHGPATSAAPVAGLMLGIGALALLVNLSVAALLYRYRDGDANMQSVWLCSRNDAIGNIAVMAAALGVFGSGSAWPDWLVATAMGGLAISAGASVWRRALAELRAASTGRGKENAA